MKIRQVIEAIRAMGFNVTLGDEENYYIDEDPQLRIHFDTDTREVYPLFYYKRRKYYRRHKGKNIKLRFPRDLKPLTEQELFKRLKRIM